MGEVIGIFSIIMGFVSAGVAGYITIRMAPLLRRLDKADNATALVSKDRKEEDTRINARIDDLKTDVGGVKAGIPNCEARRQEIMSELTTFKSELREMILDKLIKIAGDNLELREEFRERLMAETSTWSRESISRAAAEKIVNDAKTDLRREIQREVNDLKERINSRS